MASADVLCAVQAAREHATQQLAEMQETTRTHGSTSTQQLAQYFQYTTPWHQAGGHASNMHVRDFHPVESACELEAFFI